MILSRECILAQNDELKAAVLRFSACASLPNCGELRRLTLRIEGSCKWLDCGCADQLFIDQFCAAIRGLSFATMDVRPERPRGAGWGVEDVLLALVRMLRHHLVRVSDAARVCSRIGGVAGSPLASERVVAHKNYESNNAKVTEP